jgi:hypothetical protein
MSFKGTVCPMCNSAVASKRHFKRSEAIAQLIADLKRDAVINKAWAEESQEEVPKKKSSQKAAAKSKSQQRRGQQLGGSSSTTSLSIFYDATQASAYPPGMMPESVTAGNAWDAYRAIEATKPDAAGRKKLGQTNADSASSLAVQNGLASLIDRDKDQQPEEESHGEAAALRLLKGSFKTQPVSSTASSSSNRLLGAQGAPSQSKVLSVAGNIQKLRQHQQKYHLEFQDFDAILHIRQHVLDSPIIIPKGLGDTLICYRHATVGTVPTLLEQITSFFIAERLPKALQQQASEAYREWKESKEHNGGKSDEDEEESEVLPPAAKRARRDDDDLSAAADGENNGSVAPPATLILRWHQRKQLCELLKKVKARHVRFFVGEAGNPHAVQQEILFKTGSDREDEEESLTRDGGPPGLRVSEDDDYDDDIRNSSSAAAAAAAAAAVPAPLSKAQFKSLILNATKRPRATDLPIFLRSFISQQRPASRAYPHAIDATKEGGASGAVGDMRPIDLAAAEEAASSEAEESSDDSSRSEGDDDKEEKDEGGSVILVSSDDDNDDSKDNKAKERKAASWRAQDQAAEDEEEEGAIIEEEHVADNSSSIRKNQQQGMSFIRFAADFWRYFDVPLPLFYSINFRHPGLKQLAWDIVENEEGKEEEEGGAGNERAKWEKLKSWLEEGDGLALQGTDGVGAAGASSASSSSSSSSGGLMA